MKVVIGKKTFWVEFVQSDARRRPLLAVVNAVNAVLGDGLATAADFAVASSARADRVATACIITDSQSPNRRFLGLAYLHPADTNDDLVAMAVSLESALTDGEFTAFERTKFHRELYRAQ